MPSSITVNLLSRAMKASSDRGAVTFLIDGFPRTKENWAAWLDIIKDQVNNSNRIFLVIMSQNTYKSLSNKKLFNQFLKFEQTPTDIFLNKAVSRQAEVRFMLFYDCPEEVCVERVLKRQEGRADDTEEIVRRRIQVGHGQLNPF